MLPTKRHETKVARAGANNLDAFYQLNFFCFQTVYRTLCAYHTLHKSGLGWGLGLVEKGYNASGWVYEGWGMLRIQIEDYALPPNHKKILPPICSHLDQSQRCSGWGFEGADFSKQSLTDLDENKKWVRDFHHTTLSIRPFLKPPFWIYCRGQFGQNPCRGAKTRGKDKMK